MIITITITRDSLSDGVEITASEWERFADLASEAFEARGIPFSELRFSPDRWLFEVEETDEDAVEETIGRVDAGELGQWRTR